MIGGSGLIDGVTIRRRRLRGLKTTPFINDLNRFWGNPVPETSPEVLLLSELLGFESGAVKVIVSTCRMIEENRLEMRWQKHRVLRSVNLLKIWRTSSSGKRFSEEDESAAASSSSCDFWKFFMFWI